MSLFLKWNTSINSSNGEHLCYRVACRPAGSVQQQRCCRRLQCKSMQDVHQTKVHVTLPGCTSRLQFQAMDVTQKLGFKSLVWKGACWTLEIHHGNCLLPASLVFTPWPFHPPCPLSVCHINCWHTLSLENEGVVVERWHYINTALDFPLLRLPAFFFYSSVSIQDNVQPKVLRLRALFYLSLSHSCCSVGRQVSRWHFKNRLGFYLFNLSRLSLRKWRLERRLPVLSWVAIIYSGEKNDKGM